MVSTLILATKEDLAELETRLAQTESRLIPWMFIFWTGQTAVLAGLMIAPGEVVKVTR